MRLGLGTAQFGLDYGLTNESGRVSMDEIQKILQASIMSGMEIVDTAHLYGESERALGQSQLGELGLKVVTKTPYFVEDLSASENMRRFSNAFERSLSDLGVDSVYALLVHNASDLLGSLSKLLVKFLKNLRAKGKVQKIGVSLYEPAQLNDLFDVLLPDLVQLPINVFDQRFLRSGSLKMLKDADVEIHTRSAFLQGLVLCDPVDLPSHFDSYKRLIRDFKSHIQNQGLEPIQATFSFLKSVEEIDHIICGVDNCSQYEQLSKLFLVSEPMKELGKFACFDPAFIDPREWKI